MFTLAVYIPQVAVGFPLDLIHSPKAILFRDPNPVLVKTIFVLFLTTNCSTSPISHASARVISFFIWDYPFLISCRVSVVSRRFRILRNIDLLPFSVSTFSPPDLMAGKSFLPSEIHSPFGRKILLCDSTVSPLRAVRPCTTP